MDDADREEHSYQPRRSQYFNHLYSQNKLDEALLTSGRVADAISSLQEWLNKTEATLAEDQSVLGDIDTVSMLTEQHKSIYQEIAAREQTVDAMKASDTIPANQLEELLVKWERVNHLCDIREGRLKEATRLAEEFQDVVQIMRDFLPQAEAELKFRALPDDELAIIHLIERHEKFQEQLRSHQDTVDNIKTLAEEILSHCHPNGIRFVKYYLTITQTRWDQLIQRAKGRAVRLQEALRNIQGNAALLEELLAWLTDAQVLLATKERDPIPDDLAVVDTLVKEHVEFHDEVTSKNADVDRLCKLVTSESKLSQGRHYGSNWKLNESEGTNPRVVALQTKWRIVWRMSVDRKKILQDALDHLLELESFKNFDFDLWSQRYLNWIKAKKFRITDFFRRQDKDMDGALTRDEFVGGMLQSKFPSNRTELNAVFDIFDRNGTGYINYQDFIEALKPERHKAKSRMKPGYKKVADSEMIHDEIERHISQCQCRHQFRVEKIGDGKYLFGEQQKVRLVRFLNSCVMVRVGGGWVTIDEFLETNDPCRAKGRLNTELRESFILPEGATQTRATFHSRRSTTPGISSPGKKRPNDAGYASSNSSVAAQSTLRRNKVTSSMINLSGNSPMNRSSDFGSTSSLNRSKRLSTSQTSLNNQSSRTPRSKTPTTPTTPTTPNSSRSFTPTTSRYTPNSSRTTTPTTPRSSLNYSPKTTSTPTRTGFKSSTPRRASTPKTNGK